MFRRTRAAGITRGGWPCYRAGGNICYADTPEGRNREHAILHAERCVAVKPLRYSPGPDCAGRQVRLAHAQGERVVDAEDYFIGPDIDITRLHILQPGGSANRHSYSFDVGRRAILF